MPVKRSLAERLMEKVMPEPNSGCWLWLGAIDREGYGQIRSDASDWRQVKAHRASYELEHGPVPRELVMDHKCKNKSCVNPAHLEPVTSKENSVRANAWRTHCVKGHELTPENSGRDGGTRYCRICKRARYTAWSRTESARAWRKSQQMDGKPGF